MNDLREIIKLIPGYDPYAGADGYEFDVELAQYHIDFVQTCCRHVKGPKGGQPIVLEPWEKAIFANLYGWKSKATGFRRYREALVYIPRGNAKTTLAACIVNIHLFLENEPGAELYSSAAERDQARLCFDAVAGMIRQEPEMDRRARIYQFSIVVADKAYKYLSADAGTKHGFNVQLLVNDELHAHRTPELTEVLMTGTGKRNQPLVVHLTTADYERENSICNQKHDYARRVRDNSKNAAVGTNDPAFLPVIYEASVEDDWTDPEVWTKANPNLGVSVPMEYLQRECKRAQDDLAYRPTFQRLHLNIRTKSRSRWLAPEKWAASAGVILEDELVGMECGAGLDLSSKYDLTAFVKCFKMDSGVYKLMPRFWIPEEVARERDRKDRIPYLQWAEQGAITLIPGGSVDYDAIEKAIEEDFARYRIRRVAYDPWNANATRTRLEAHGIEMVEFTQTIRNFNEPTKEFGRLVNDGLLHHGNHPVLSWCAENVEVYTDASGNIRPVKPQDGSPLKIDGIVAGVMALWCVLPYDANEEVSFYEHHSFEAT